MIVICLIPVWGFASWKTMSNDYFMVYYRSGMEDEALHALKVMEQYRPRLERLTGNTSHLVAIKLEDMGNLVNGYANPIGNQIGLFMYPPTKGSLAQGEDWFQTVATHEYIHQLQITHEGGLPREFRKYLGNILYVQLHQPMWMTEGITVYGESQLSPYSGRMNGAYYSALVSALAAEDKLPSRTKAAYYSFDTPQAHYYVYGGSFHHYLARRYGEQRFGDLYKDNSSRVTAYLNGALPMLALDPAFQNAYGKPLAELWQEWQAEEKSKAKPQSAQRITQDGDDKEDLKYYDGALYYVRSLKEKTGPGMAFTLNGLMKIELSDPMREPVEVLRQATEFPASYHVVGDKIYFSRTEYRRGFGNKDNDGYGSITQIMLKDSRGTRKIYSGQVRAFLPISDTEMLIAEDLPLYRGSVLMHYSLDTGEQKTLYSGEALVHKIFRDKDDIYINAKQYWRNSGIFRLQKGILEPVLESPNWQELVAVENGVISYNTIQDNQLQAWIYNTQSRVHARLLYDQYIKDPIQAPDGSTYFLSVSSKGMDLYHAPIKSPSTPTHEYSMPIVPIAKERFQGQRYLFGNQEIQHGGYLNNIAHLLNPRMVHFPMIYGNGDSLAIGAVLAGSDAVGDFPSYMISGVYDYAQKEFVGSFSLSSTVLAPINQDLMISSDDDGTYMLNQSVSLYKRQNYGLNSVNVGLGSIAWDDWQRKMLYPFVSQQYSWSGGSFGLRNTLLYEAQDMLDSNRDRLGWQGVISLRQRISKHSEFQGSWFGAYDPDADSEDVFYAIRGYDDELHSSKGFTLRNTWYTPLVRIRQGLWNPQIYLEDINMGVFFDAAGVPQKLDESLLYSYGVELTGEFGVFFQGQLNAGIRLGINRDDETFVGLILGM
ncbi:MAG TPA: hypothetical protein PKL34_03040 [Candidatus Cloacimonadota bacterium]|nr:hypothetical protein [Candidatus Cloacimonadota bacterium]